MRGSGQARLHDKKSWQPSIISDHTYERSAFLTGRKQTVRWRSPYKSAHPGGAEIVAAFCAHFSSLVENSSNSFLRTLELVGSWCGGRLHALTLIHADKLKLSSQLLHVQCEWDSWKMNSQESLLRYHSYFALAYIPLVPAHNAYSSCVFCVFALFGSVVMHTESSHRARKHLNKVY